MPEPIRTTKHGSWYLCEVCGAEFASPRKRGSHPSRCWDHISGPGAAMNSRRGHEIVLLRERVAALEHLAVTRSNEAVGSRLELARAVKAVGKAEGREATAHALVRLSAVADAWADALSYDGRGKAA